MTARTDSPLVETAHADTTPLRAFLARVSRRHAIIAAMQGAAAGLAVALVPALAYASPHGALTPRLLIGISFAALGAIVALVYTHGTRRRIAHLIEHRAPASRNVLLTAHELVSPRAATPTATAPPHITALVCREAARLTETLDVPRLFPAARTVIALAAAAALFLFVAARDAAPVRAITDTLRTAVAPDVPRIDDVEIIVTPPAYAARAPLTLRNVSRIEALAGSRLQLRVRGHADTLVVQTLLGARHITPADGEFRVDIPADADGFIALAPRLRNEPEGARRLIGVTVTDDAPPRVRIVTPGRDLFLREPDHVIDLAVESDDDLGLASLRLHYTRVAGSGERFTFTDGEVPLDITRASAREWKARARWPLAGLELAPGDMVVYRAIAADRRPGAPPQESDAFIAEIVAPGGDAADGFAIDPDQERYAVSQQMLVIKTERLIARRAAMTDDSLLLAAHELAAEQRKIRAEFMFMMGGELEDEHGHDGDLDDLGEEAEAEAEDDILAGRLENQGRIALMRAIRSMSRAATLLTNVDLGDALTAEKAAVDQLEEAFSRTRILLRALSQREALDLSRRLTGELADARSDRRPVAAPRADPRTAALRQALAHMAAIAGEPRANAETAARLTTLAETLLRVDPSSEALQELSARLADAAANVSARPDQTRERLDRAITDLSALLRRDLPAASARMPSFEAGRLDGALTDALRAAPASPR